MDVTQIALILISLAGTIITAIVVPVLRSKLNNDQLQNLYTWANIAVKAAEQLCRNNRLAPEHRKQYVIDFLQEHGFTMDVDKINDLIESIVYELPPLLIKEEPEDEGEWELVYKTDTEEVPNMFDDK